MAHILVHILYHIIGIGKWDDDVLGMYGEREWLGFVLMRCHIAGGLFIGKINVTLNCFCGFSKGQYLAGAVTFVTLANLNAGPGPYHAAKSRCQSHWERCSAVGGVWGKS